jgi:hypothetical protein
MAASDLDIPMRLVLDDWMVPADSVPVMILPGEAVVRIRVSISEATALITRLAEQVRTLEDAHLFLARARLDVLMPATPASPEPDSG